MKEITLTLSAEEAIFIVQVFGQLPNSSNAYPLMMKIKQQFDLQMAEKDSLPEQ
jgi:hypothetical protein